MLLRIGTLRLNVGSLELCAKESRRGEGRWSRVLHLTLSYPQLLEKEILGQKKGAEKKKEGRKKKGKGERERRLEINKEKEQSY